MSFPSQFGGTSPSASHPALTQCKPSLNIFAGRSYSCNDSLSSGLTACIGEYVSSPVDNSLPFLAPRVWANPGLDSTTTVWSFDSFRQSVLILFEIVSLEGWIDVMSASMNIVGKDVQAQENASQWNALFFLIFNLFGGVIILTLFVRYVLSSSYTCYTDSDLA